MTYSEKLREPRWQRRRLELFASAGWKCQECGSTTRNLQAHHCSYAPLIEPWDLPDSVMMVLCEVCHEHRQGFENTIRFEIGKIMRNTPLPRLNKMMWYFIDEALKDGKAFNP